MHRGVCTSCVNKVWRGVLFEFYKIVFLASETYLFGVFEYVGCMFRFDAFDQMHFSVVVGIAYCVKACAVHGHRVERCEDAYIGHLYGCRVRHAGEAMPMDMFLSAPPMPAIGCPLKCDSTIRKS